MELIIAALHFLVSLYLLFATLVAVSVAVSEGLGGLSMIAITGNLLGFLLLLLGGIGHVQNYF